MFSHRKPFQVGKNAYKTLQNHQYWTSSCIFVSSLKWKMKMKMGSSIKLSALIALASLFPVIHGWGVDGHFIICRIAQSRLSEAAADAVKQLLPDYSDNDLASLCSWADRVKFRYHWSSPLHYIDTPDDLCNYKYGRDCKDENGEEGFCVSGAIQNYTKQLLTYGTTSESQYNLTEALLFLSHFVGDIHQPLHVGFTSDKGGNTIDVHWYRRKTVLHHVWDDNIIETAEEQFYGSSVEDMIDVIKKNITGEWAGLIDKWEKCNSGRTVCPDINFASQEQAFLETHYTWMPLPEPCDAQDSVHWVGPSTLILYATESITAACDWAYKNVTEDSTLDDNYFLSRYPIANLRLAESGVRLAATLNRIFG